MPSSITHEYHYRDVYKYTTNDFKNSFDIETYRKYSLFAQGHDALFFLDFWNLLEQKNHHKKAIYLQDHDFKKICLELIELIRTYNLEESKELKLMLYGFITHHILDSVAHPYIIYETKNFGLHEAVESYIDGKMIEKKEQEEFRKYPVHRIIPSLPEINQSTIQVINEAFYNVYQYKNFGNDYIRALHQVNPFLYFLRYDPIGVKKFGYNIVDRMNLTKTKYSWLSYYNKLEGYDKYLNEEHRPWINPVDNNIVSTESFDELYEKAIYKTAIILSEIEEAIENGASMEEFEKIIPDISAVHGQKCDQNLKLKYLKK